jgi:hypothetical protein
MTLAVTVVVLLVVVALLAAGGALDRTRRVPVRRARVGVPRRRTVVEEPVATERVVERVVERPDGRL